MIPNPSQTFLPLFEFPTKVVLVDDNIDFVKNLQMLFSPKGTEFIVFSHPHEALEYLQKRTYCTFAEDHLNLKNNHEIFNKNINRMFSKNININLCSLYQQIYNPKRFDEVSLVVIDYNMPEMSGQEFCQRISNLPVQKMLLTGEASYEKAVEMFNGKLINSFVKKGEDFQILFQNIKDLQNKYFQNITKSTLFALQPPNGNSIFSDIEFIDFFNLLCKEYNFIEHYVVDENGSHLLADASGKTKLLIVKTEENMQTLCDLAESDLESTKDIFDTLQERKKIVFFQEEEDLLRPINTWSLYDAISLNYKETYYYALIDIDSNFNLDRNKITWFKHHLTAEYET